MSVESEPGPNANSQRDFASLQGCFVEGNPEQRARERRIRRRALIISVATQAAILTAIILVPLFGKPERIALANMVPIPPYYHSSAPERPNTLTTPTRHQERNLCATCYSPNFPAHPATTSDPTSEPPPPGFEPTAGMPGPQTPWAIGIGDNRRQPERPVDPRPQTPHRISVTHLEPAMLIRRVEPVYPQLARQIHREGRVELHAIIATDGTIQSLQVVSGAIAQQFSMASLLKLTPS
jgi:hypothetical protein